MSTPGSCGADNGRTVVTEPSECCRGDGPEELFGTKLLLPLPGGLPLRSRPPLGGTTHPPALGAQAAGALSAVHCEALKQMWFEAFFNVSSVGHREQHVQRPSGRRDEPRKKPFGHPKAGRVLRRPAWPRHADSPLRPSLSQARPPLTHPHSSLKGDQDFPRGRILEGLGPGVQASLRCLGDQGRPSHCDSHREPWRVSTMPVPSVQCARSGLTGALSCWTDDSSPQHAEAPRRGPGG